MKKIIFIFTLIFMFCSTNLHAARFGGGKSFGQNRSSHSSRSSEKSQPQQQQQQHQQQQQQHNAQTPPKSSFASKLLPALAGLSMGALLGSLLSGHGLGGGLGIMLIMLAVAGIAFYAIKKFMASKVNARNFNGFQNAATQTDAGQTMWGNTYQAPLGNRNTYESPNNYHTSNNLSLSFNKEEFLRTAKTTFLRMQNAYDNKNLADIKIFTTPEVFAEIQMQIQERDHAMNQTDVIRIYSSLIDLDDREVDNISANVLFSGQIREQQNAPLIEINEVWYFTKQSHNNWLVAGIEQKN